MRFVVYIAGHRLFKLDKAQINLLSVPGQYLREAIQLKDKIAMEYSNLGYRFLGNSNLPVKNSIEGVCLMKLHRKCGSRQILL